MTLPALKILALVVIAFAISGISCSGYRLDRNRRLWNDSGVTDYRMKVDIQKPGHATPMGKYIIEVRGRHVATVRSPSNPEAVIDTSTYLREFARYDTIDDIFSFIERNRSSFALTQQIEYDAVLGYPKKIHMDPDMSAIDDELSFEVLEFEKL
jgi:hypothetical protein